MSKPRSPSEPLDSELLPHEAQFREELSPEQWPAQELSPEDVAVLSRARRQRFEERAPEDLRQRAGARALEEAAGRAAAHAVPTAALVSVARPSLRFGLRLLALAAAVVGSIVGAPALLRSVSNSVAQGPEPRSGDWQASGPAGELLAHPSPLLRLPLLPVPEDQPSTSGPSLFGERPFAPSGRAWQVRRWNDPKAEPEEPAAYGFEDGALCVPLGAGERVLGGWPWPAAGASAPAPVPISRGHAYRVGFRAWFRGSLPAQMLLGVGHIQFPFVAAAAARVQVSAEPQRFEMDFVASHDDAAVGIAFLATSRRGADPTRVCLADVTLGER